MKRSVISNNPTENENPFTKANTAVEATIEVMENNCQKLVEKSEKLRNLDQTTADYDTRSVVFQSSTRNTEGGSSSWRNAIIRVCLGLLLFLVLCLAIFVVCKNFKWTYKRDRGFRYPLESELRVLSQDLNPE